MSLLTLIHAVTDDIGLVRPVSVIGNPNTEIHQILALAQKEGEDLVSRYQWQFKFTEVIFTSVAAQLQGTMTAIAGGGYKYIVNDTMWDRTSDLPIIGPIAARDWQALQAFPVTGPYIQFRIQNDQLLFDPNPSAGLEIAFEIFTEAFCQSDEGVKQDTWLADTDVGVCDEKLMRLGIIWRWHQRKKLEYSEDFSLYERRVADACAQDGGKQMSRLDGRVGERLPGVFVPEGSWSIT